MSHSSEPDLSPNLACLKTVDNLLRCPICFDFLNISMMTPCSHNFCSLCIRKFLSYKLLCPVCNMPMTEQDLRNNRILDDLAQCFQSARQQLSQASFESPPISPKTPSMEIRGKKVRQKGPRKEGTTLTHFFQKRSPALSVGPQADSKPLIPVKQEPMEVCVLDPTEPQLEGTESDTMGLKEEKMDVCGSPSTSQVVQPVVKVECPVCGVSVSHHHINKHLDVCLTTDEKKEGLRRSESAPLMTCGAKTLHSSGKRRLMTKPVYNLMTKLELKKRLKDCHLSTRGSRDELVSRHQDFLHIYNAQCDALNPRSSENIAKEVEHNEKMRNQLDNKSKPEIIVTRNKTAEEIEQLHSHYRKEHSNEFSRLIAQVRGRLATSGKTQFKQEQVKSVELSCFPADPKVVQSTTQTALPNNEKMSAPETVSRSPSPSLSDVSLSSSISDVFS
ncbi:E3 ubiquitin-protein ligase RAD18 isoform X1 [Electrophorus electricus]|uniref:RING-type E3 ubiquitin transferase n=1 Tax=Electrophorus electricus TaxID=8005 RepID=A0A4W4HKX5_ELEEL|nr:E3 ubiquitin-protein ligase RAD18 isoform X1 [Electrophorus electricus]